MYIYIFWGTPVCDLGHSIRFICASNTRAQEIAKPK